ncbi:MAG: hypothetical protein ACOC0M_00490 [Halomonas sp.]
MTEIAAAREADDTVNEQLCARIEELESEKEVLVAQLDRVEEERDALAAQIESDAIVCDSYRQERDALAAHVERLSKAIHQAAVYPVSVTPGTAEAEELQDLREIIGVASASQPTTSLARRDALKQAEALEGFAIHCRHLASNAADNGYMAQADAVCDMADEATEQADQLRRQAEEPTE